MFKKNIKFLLPFAAFVTVIPCPALHCRPGTFWTYPLIFTLMLLSCLLASAAVFLFRRSALFLLLPLGGYLFGSLLYFIVSGGGISGPARYSWRFSFFPPSASARFSSRGSA